MVNEPDSKLYLIGMSKVPGLGPKTSRNLISYCGGAERVFHVSDRELLRIPGVGNSTVAAIKTSAPLKAAEQELRFAEQQGVKIHSFLDLEYPDRLKEIYESPLVIYQKGSVSLNEMPAIAIVGTRKPSAYGRAQAERFSRYLSANGINVVSGLAYGIDGEAHGASLKSGGVTTAVLGHGLDRVYPSVHRQKAKKIAEKGALLTEFCAGTKPDAHNFPARNRIISGMSVATLVVEAGDGGGALITAKFAFDQNREVYAIPGNLGQPTSVGCNQLIRDQVAKLVMSPEELLADLEPILGMHCAKVGDVGSSDVEAWAFDDDERRVVEFLAGGDAVVNQISQGTGLGVGKLGSVLIMLELKGVLKQVPGNRYSRIA